MGLCTKKGRRDTQPPAGPSLLALRITTAIWHPCQSSEQMIYPSVSFESSLFSPMFAAGERRMFFSSTWEILYESILFVASVPGLFLVKAKSLLRQCWSYRRRRSRENAGCAEMDSSLDSASLRAKYREFNQHQHEPHCEWMWERNCIWTDAHCAQVHKCRLVRITIKAVTVAADGGLPMSISSSWNN